MRQRRILTAALILTMAAGSLLAMPATQAAPPDEPYFSRTWERTDYPVADGAVTRTWMWGPEAFTPPGQEYYNEAPDGIRTVQYFDKSRMEITDPTSDSSSPWFVTNGLLATEMVTGLIQYGDLDLDPHWTGPADVNVAGDADDPTGPTYRSFSGHMFDPPLDPGTLITQRINRVGTVTYDASLADYNVSAGFLDTVTNHTVAAPFWEFMNSTGLVYEDGSYTDDDLFLNPFYATGRPITEAYWANVKVADSYQEVLMQCFERRCLTYTPGNAPEWQVEAGNVGRHYYAWLYGDFGETPPNAGLRLYETSDHHWTEWPTHLDVDDDRRFGDPAGTAQRCNGSFCIHIPAGTNTWTASRGDLPAYDDVAAVTRIALIGMVAGDRGCLMTRVVETPELLQFYAFCLTGTADLIAFYYEESPAGPTATWLIPPGEARSPVPVTDWQTLLIVSQGHDFWFAANGTLIDQVTHAEGPLEGDVAVGAQRLAAGPDEFRAAFDELAVYAVH